MRSTAEMTEVVAYRAYCLLALGRMDEARALVESLVLIDPFFRPPVDQVSPRVRTFFDDVRRHGMGYVHFVRSPYAHARIVSIDVSKALELEGVYGTITGDEVAIQTDPFFEMSVEEIGFDQVNPEFTFTAILT